MHTTTVSEMIPYLRERQRALHVAILLVFAIGSAIMPAAYQTQAQTTPFQIGAVNDGAVGIQTGAYLTFPYEIEEGTGGPPGGAPAPAINGAMTAVFSNINVISGGGIIGGDALEFDVTITNTSPAGSGVVLSAFAFQSKFSESPALGSRIGDKLFYGQTVPGSLVTTAASALGTVKKNGTSNGLYTGKWKGICINSSLDFIPEFNSGLEDESLECAGNRADLNADGDPELLTGSAMLGLRPGESQVIRLRLDSGTTDGALHVVQQGTLTGTVTGTELIGPNGITYFVPTIDTPGTVLEIVEFGDNKVLRDANGDFNPTFAPASDGLSFTGQQYLTLPRRNFAFTDIIGRNHTCATYGLTLGACAGNPAGSPLLNFLGTGDLVPDVQNFAAILRGYGEFYDPDGDFVPDENPSFPGDTRPSFPYGVLCENCGGRPYTPIAEFYLDNGDGSVTRQMVAGSYGDPVTQPYLATISSATAEDLKEEIIPEPDPGGPRPGPRLGTSANGEFHSLQVVPGAGINGGDAIEFTIDITNNSSNPNAYLTAFNYQTKERGLADIGILDGYTQDRRDIRVANLTVPGYLPDCTGINDGACWNAALGVGHFPNTIGNGLLFGQMVWQDANAGREPLPVDSDQVYVSPSGINPTPFWLESVKKNGPFSPILKGNENFICVKSGLFDLDPDADAACAGQPAILVDPDEPPTPANITQRLGLPPGQTQSVRIRMEFGDFRGAMLRIVSGLLTSANIDPRYGPAGTNTNGLARFFDCSDQRELEWCHPYLVGTNIGYLPNTDANWLTPANLSDIEYVIINQPGDAPTVMNFQQNFGYILAMAGFVPSAEFYAPDPNDELDGTPFEGVLIRQQVLGEYLITPPALAPTITSLAVTSAMNGTPYSYDVEASAFPGATFSLLSAPSDMTINSSTGLINWIPSAAGTYNVQVQAANSVGSDTQSFQITVISNILDNFNRSNGGVGANWIGSTSTASYRIRDNQVDVEAGGPLYWRNPAFGPSQEASVRLTTIDPKGKHHTIILKAQNRDWGKGAILVSYNAVTKKITVESRGANANKWTLHTSLPITLKAGDVLGARALANGSVVILVNGTIVGTTNAVPFFVNRGGYIGVWFMDTPKAFFDDFTGGNVN